MDFFQHDVGEDEISAVGAAIRQGHLTTGVFLDRFAEALETRFGLPRVELCSSGTSALHLALHALGVGPGDEVITTPYVGVWTSNPILMVGATPVYADIDRQSYNLDPESVRSRLSSRTKVVLPVAVNGNPVHVEELRDVLPPGVRIVVDDIEALGSSYTDRQGKVRYCGDYPGNDISVGGFWVSKQVTTCGGGMAVSRDDAFLDRFEKLTRHGHGRVGNMWEQHFGFNSWLSDPMAAMGVVQVQRFDEKQARLLRVRAMLDKFFAQDVRQVVRSGDSRSEFIYLIELPVGVCKVQYSAEMDLRGVPVRPYFNSLLEVPHLSQYASSCPVTAEVSSRTVALPYHHKLTQGEVVNIYINHGLSVAACETSCVS